MPRTELDRFLREISNKDESYRGLGDFSHARDLLIISFSRLFHQARCLGGHRFKSRRELRFLTSLSHARDMLIISFSQENRTFTFRCRRIPCSVHTTQFGFPKQIVISGAGKCNLVSMEITASLQLNPGWSTGSSAYTYIYLYETDDQNFFIYFYEFYQTSIDVFADLSIFDVDKLRKVTVEQQERRFTVKFVASKVSRCTVCKFWVVLFRQSS